MMKKLIPAFVLALSVVFTATALYAEEAGEKGSETAAMEPADVKLRGTPYSYERGGRRDPFVPIIIVAAPPGPGEFRSPPEMFDITQIKLVAIVKSDRGWNALVKLPDSKHYTLTEGMLIGLHRGQIIKISENSLAVIEELKDYRGRDYTNQVEIKLREEEQ